MIGKVIRISIYKKIRVGWDALPNLSDTQVKTEIKNKVTTLIIIN